ncbi:DUF1684 domain-containing protein [Streptomyces sp. NBC_01020]|uniref:DUF1684 domain-containing protein n=1 Tax=unclassified Streptomyces TaxID=2593676 RepID=UPI002E1C52F6|nr:DUF1684 domain-containing protein [Streptomyces sp. NBC_01020]WSX70701.1 DUF1684 domain-containing protein [Streptomyces sp. NBC_00932]
MTEGTGSTDGPTTATDGSTGSTTAEEAGAPGPAGWRAWHEQRTATVTAPYGPLALTGTHWLDDAQDGRIPDVAGHWEAAGDEVVLTATAEDGLSLDGEPFTGRTALTADHTPPAQARIAQGDRRLVVVRREGLWAVRVWDPDSANRRAFAGIEATPYHPEWVLPGLYRPYGASRTVQVPNADGRDRGLGLSGELAFHLEGDEHTLQVAQEEDGSLWAVFADTTSGTSSYRFRFLRPSAPAADGRVSVDFNRTLLPPCAFAEHFICPFPPPGNTLPVAVTAGERTARTG